MSIKFTYPVPFESIQEYEEAAMRTAKDMGSMNMNLIHAAMGLSSDSGEFVDAIKKHVIYNKELDYTNAIEELGDVLWFVSLAAKSLGTTMGFIMTHNIEKLAKRYPDKYTDQAAQVRADKVTEDAGMLAATGTLMQNPFKVPRHINHELQAAMDSVKSKSSDVIFISPNYIDAANYKYYYCSALDSFKRPDKGGYYQTVVTYGTENWNDWYNKASKVPA